MYGWVAVVVVSFACLHVLACQTIGDPGMSINEGAGGKPLKMLSHVCEGLYDIPAMYAHSRFVVVLLCCAMLWPQA